MDLIKQAWKDYWDCWKNVLHVHSSISRKKYWMWKITNWVCMGIGIVIALLIAFALNFTWHKIIVLGGTAYIIMHFAMYIPHALMYLQRYHDAHISDWILAVVLVLGFIPVVSSIASVINTGICLLPENAGDKVKDTEEKIILKNQKAKS